MRNLQSKVPEDQWADFKTWAQACYRAAASPTLAHLLRDDTQRPMAAIWRPVTHHEQWIGQTA
jgi:hypothetical protein